jgi:hypothetical protein
LMIRDNEIAVAQPLKVIFAGFQRALRGVTFQKILKRVDFRIVNTLRRQPAGLSRMLRFGSPGSGSGTW